MKTQLMLEFLKGLFLGIIFSYYILMTLMMLSITLLSMLLILLSTRSVIRQVAIYHYRTTIRPCIECCCHVCTGAPSCYLDMLDDLQKWVCRNVRSSLFVSWTLFSSSKRVTSVGITLVDIHLNSCSDGLYDFSITISRY